MGADGHVIDQDIYLAQLFNSFSHHLFDTVRVGDVGNHSVDLYSQLAALCGYVVQFSLAGARVQDQVSPFPGKCYSDLSANVPAGSGDQGGLSFQSHG